MVEVRLEVGVKEFAASGFGASAGRFDGHKNRVNFRQNARVLELEHPAVLFLIVYIEDSQTLGWALGWPAGPPSLEGSIAPLGSPIAQVKGIKDQRLFLRVKDAAKSASLLAFAVHVEHVNNMKIARAHQVMDVAACS